MWRNFHNFSEYSPQMWWNFLVAKIPCGKISSGKLLWRKILWRNLVWRIILLPNNHFITYKPYLVKVTTKGGGGQNTQKFDHVVYGWPITYVCTIRFDHLTLHHRESLCVSDFYFIHNSLIVELWSLVKMYHLYLVSLGVIWNDWSSQSGKITRMFLYRSWHPHWFVDT